MAITVRGRRIALALRDMRAASGLTLADVEAATGLSQSAVSRMERGLTAVNLLKLRALMDVYGVHDKEEREELEQVVRDRGRRGLWLPRDDRFQIAPGYQVYCEYELEAKSVRYVASNLVPGLLQARAYIDALERDWPETAEQSANLKVARQAESLHRLTISAIVDEAVLWRVVGDHEVMAQQMDHFLNLARQPNISIRVLPYDSGMAGLVFGDLTIFDLTGQGVGDAVTSPNPTGGDVFHEDDGNVRRMAEMYDRMTAVSLSAEQSEEALIRIRDQHR